MQAYQETFIKLAIEAEALRFGQFTLKSGRQSPYFFNAGQFNRGSHLATLGHCYAEKIVAMNQPFDVLFGPAYKGIPLVAATAAALAEHFDRDVPYAFNRKETKAHGEGGLFVGAPVTGRVLIVDDVITAGTAIREVAALLESGGQATVGGVLVGLDRQEVASGGGQQGLSALEAMKDSLNAPVESIVKLEHLLEYLSNNSPIDDDESAKLIGAIKDYQASYGCSSCKVID